MLWLSPAKAESFSAAHPSIFQPFRMIKGYPSPVASTLPLLLSTSAPLQGPPSLFLAIRLRMQQTQSPGSSLVQQPDTPPEHKCPSSWAPQKSCQLPDTPKKPWGPVHRLGKLSFLREYSTWMHRSGTPRFIPEQTRMPSLLHKAS